jgi:hypothetical protein
MRATSAGGINHKGDYKQCRYLIIYAWIAENQTKFLFQDQQISLSAIRAAAVI